MDSPKSINVSKPSFEQKQQFFAQAILAIAPAVLKQYPHDKITVVERTASIAKALTYEWARQYQIIEKNDTP